MPDPLIANLLILQECDSRYDRIKQQLESIPQEIARNERKIEEENGAIAAEKNALMELEVRRKELDIEVSTAEEQSGRYKTQQLAVKKNEEYKALQHEIDTIETKVSELEDEEIALMLEIDEQTEKTQRKEEEHRKNISDLESDIERLKKHAEEYQAELGDAEKAVKEAAAEVEDKDIKVYDYVKKFVKRPPYVVPVEDHKCGGCHLKLSTDLETEAREKGKLARCNNCGRIIFL